MTQPDQLRPKEAANHGSFADYAATTEEEWREQMRFQTSKHIKDTKTGFGGIGRDIGTIISNIVNAWTGWPGFGWRHEDSEQAMLDAAATIAGLSASVTALENNQNNQAVGGVGVTVDLTALPSGSTFGSDFSHIRSGGSGHYKITTGVGAEWDSVNDSDATDAFVYTALQSSTDYQKVWIAFGASPQWFNTSSAARNEIHARKNLAGDTYVFASMEKYKAQIGCVVSGSATVFATLTGFSFKSNAVYALECGTVGGLRIYRLLEGNRVILSHTEVGTTSQVGATYRYSGGLGFARASGLGTVAPGKMWAFALGDNYPATVTGSGAIIGRSATGTVNVSSGAALLPTNFFDTPAETSSDITYDLTNGKFTVTVESWYDVEFSAKTSFFLTSSSGTGTQIDPFPFQVHLYKNGVSTMPIGDPVLPYPRGLTVSGSGSMSYGCPPSFTAATRIYLQAGDYIQIGYDAGGAKTGFLTGEASGLQTRFSIVRTGTKSPQG